MKKIEYTELDGHLLRVFMIMLEEGSVSRTASRLGQTQSTISHALGRLRRFFDDPLFIRSGHKMLPTERALSIKPSVQSILNDLQALSHGRPFDPAIEDMSFVVAANDLQRDLIFPDLLAQLAGENIKIGLRMFPSGHPPARLLRDGQCDFALTPFPPSVSDVIQKPVLHGKMVCFFDRTIRSAPDSWDSYCQADHLGVRFTDGGTSRRALTGVDTTRIPSPRISVSNFNAIPAFLKGTELLATELDLMKIYCLPDLDMEPLPFETDPVTIYLCWHQRNASDPAHNWFRQKIEATARQVMRHQRRNSARPAP